MTHYLKRCQLITLAILLPLLITVPAAGQRGRPSSSDVTHSLFGDFKVDDGNSGKTISATFRIILATVAGRTVNQQPINNNGRYMFLNVSNGEYFLVVEMDGAEALRIPIRVDAVFKTDIRKDILLEMSGTRVPAGAPSKPAIIYARPEANQADFEKALAAEKKNDNKLAISLFSKIVGADPKDFEAWTELGTVYFKTEKYDDASRSYRKALEEKPGYILALLNLGKVELSQKNNDAAIEMLTKALDADPKSAPANYFLGEAYLQVKKGSKAVGYFNEALKLDPNGMADAHLRLGALYRGAGLKDKAIAEYQQFLTKRPNHPDKSAIQQYIKENKN